jgi:hypothetical protein
VGLTSPHVRTIGTNEIIESLSERVTRIEKKLGIPPNYTLHIYDHCPFCLRVELLMGHSGLDYERVVHGYGAGAPEGSPGYDREGGPRILTGHKMLPVLQVLFEGVM